MLRNREKVKHVNILVVNAGSSSLKYQLFVLDGQKWEVLANGLCERIGIDGSNIF